MCDNCNEARKVADNISEQMNTSERVREFYRRQGECREQERIIKLLTAELTQKTMIWDEAKGHPIFVNQADLLITLIKGEKVMDSTLPVVEVRCGVNGCNCKRENK